METNAVPRYNVSDNPTACCPRFDPTGWEGQDLHFEEKLFLKAGTLSVFHIPLNMGSMYPKVMEAIERVEAMDMEQILVLSRDPSPWRGEHFFAVTKEVPGYQMVRLSGDFLTRVFEGPYRHAPRWEKEMTAFAGEKGRSVKRTYFFYTTCPKCAKIYGKNYVVGVAEVV